MSRNKKWQTELDRMPAFAATDFSVLLTGPSGSGKDVLARTIHQLSKRSQGPFICINCSSLSENLIESELFGHVKGSFTGAIHDRKGAFEAARGGTLFLDEIGDLPLALQPKLLRALENKEVRPVGSDKVIRTDVRILAATHRNLFREVRIGRFREDLLYRLNVCSIHPPALENRMEDFEHLLYRFAREMRVRFSFDAISTLKKHTWPGNIRELRNLVARAAAYMPGEHIQPEHIDQLLDRHTTKSDSRGILPSMNTPDGDENQNPNGSQVNLIKEIERELIVQRLLANQGNQRRTAADLGIPKSTLHDRLSSYQIDVSNLLRNMRP